ncbi:MAG: NUDIX hydrolase [Clostridia bacterium]|nr:NUDIX hydrolase [Clostridia bacterium]
MNLKEETLIREYQFRGRIINLRTDTVKLPNGAEAGREVVEHPGGVCVAPLTGAGELLFVRQYRYPYEEVVLELPAGKRDRKNEEPLSCGKRELLEETGATAENYTFLGKVYPTPGFCDEVIYLYLATGLSFGEAQPDEDEFVEVERIPLERAVDMVMNNEITDAKTQIAILKTARLLKQ